MEVLAVIENRSDNKAISKLFGVGATFIRVGIKQHQSFLLVAVVIL